MWKQIYILLMVVVAIIFTSYIGFLPAIGFFLLTSFIVIEKAALRKATIYGVLTTLSIYFIIDSGIYSI
jgi:hypothetical protein